MPPNERTWLAGTKPEKCIVCLQALFLYQLMVMGTDQLSLLEFIMGHHRPLLGSNVQPDVCFDAMRFRRFMFNQGERTDENTDDPDET